MIGLGFVYTVTGIMFLAFAVLSARDGANPKRWGNALFWGLLSASFFFGDRLSDLGNGVLVLCLVGLAGARLVGLGKPATTSLAERRERAERRGDWLFLPALIIPATALIGTFLFKRVTVGGEFLVDPKQATLVSLTLGVLIALGAAMAWLRPPVLAPLQEGRRLVDAVGWAAILPQMLASLGAVFLLAKVGEAVGGVASNYLPIDGPMLAVATYALGMAAFTIVMGNAFAAFPIMTAAIGLPLIVVKFGGDPAIMGAIGMLSGFCGTLMTPMAANFNVVPATLLELPDKDSPLNGVIRAQIPTALMLLAANIALMGALVYRF